MQLKFVLPSDPKFLPVVRGAMCPLAEAMGWEESDCRAIALALDEALANVIRHAYHGRTDGVMELECQVSAEGLEITLLDNGEAPDKSKLCARPVGCDRPGGLGSHIIRDVMDRVSYEITAEGNRFVALKRFPKRP